MGYAKNNQSSSQPRGIIVETLAIVSIISSIAAISLSLYVLSQLRAAKIDVDRLARHDKALRLLNDEIKTISGKLVDAQSLQNEATQALILRVARLETATEGIRRVQHAQIKLNESMLDANLQRIVPKE